MECDLTTRRPHADPPLTCGAGCADATKCPICSKAYTPLADDPYLDPFLVGRLEDHQWSTGEPAKRFIVHPGRQAVPVPELTPVCVLESRTGGPCGEPAVGRFTIRQGRHPLGPAGAPACRACITLLAEACYPFIEITELPLTPVQCP